VRFNTNTLGYKLVSGSLRESRKHSEQLNKYVAGLWDADGSLSFDYISDFVYLRGSISASAVVDTDFVMLRALRDYYDLGRITYDYQENGISRCSWRLGTTEFQTFFNRVGKHLRIKQTHFNNLLLKQREYRLKQINEYEFQELKKFSKTSRQQSTWFKRPRHLSWSWVAGFLDGDGCYRIRRRGGIIKSLCIKAASHDLHILYKLQEDFSGSINMQTKGDDTIRCWRLGLGKGHIKSSLPFLYKMRQFSCIENKYLKIQEMISFLESSTSRKD